MKVDVAPLLWVLFLVSIFIITYILNKKTPKPEGCEDIIMQIEALIALGIIGAILGLLLGIADKYLQVKEDERLTKLNDMMPKFNCGACGYPGCSGFAEGILTGDVKTLKQCKPMKPEIRIEIKEYLENSPSPQGTIIKVEV